MALKRPVALADFERALRAAPVERRHGRGGIWTARRLYLGRIPNLVPSRSFYGPNWYPDGAGGMDGKAGCAVCARRWFDAFREKRADGPSCSPSKPCQTSQPGGHCRLCRDGEWYARVMRSLTPAVQHVQPGSKLTLINDAPDREELYAIQWLERIEEGTEVVANASTAALEMIAAEGTVDNCFLACYGLRGTSTDLPTYFAECPTKESRIEAVCAILGNPKTLTMLVEKIHPRYGTRDKLRASYQFRLGLFQLWRAVQEAKRRAAETLQAP